MNLIPSFPLSSLPHFQVPFFFRSDIEFGAYTTFTNNTSSSGGRNDYRKLEVIVTGVLLSMGLCIFYFER